MYLPPIVQGNHVKLPEDLPYAIKVFWWSKFKRDEVEWRTFWDQVLISIGGVRDGLERIIERRLSVELSCAAATTMSVDMALEYLGKHSIDFGLNGKVDGSELYRFFYKASTASKEAPTTLEACLETMAAKFDLQVWRELWLPR